MRVLHVDSGREWRGGQRQVLLLARGQRERGNEPLVVGQPNSPLVRHLRAGGHAASTVRMRADWDVAAARRLRTQIKAWRPDIVHAHDARAHALALAALIGKSGIPLVVTRRVLNVPKGRLKYGKRVARFIAISQAVKAALVRGSVDPERVDVVYSGVPRPTHVAARDWRAELDWPAETVLCGIVGAMSREKGIDLIHEVADNLPRDVIQRTRLLLLGGQAAGHESIGGLLAFRAGFIDKIHEAMAGLDVLWHPSSAEGLGTSVIDAMALGVPPIAFAVGGLPELVESEASGILIPPGDTSAFAGAISRLVRSPEERRRLALAGPSRASLFGVDRMVVGTEAAYRHVLRQS